MPVERKYVFAEIFWDVAAIMCKLQCRWNCGALLKVRTVFRYFHFSSCLFTQISKAILCLES